MTCLGVVLFFALLAPTNLDPRLVVLKISKKKTAEKISTVGYATGSGLLKRPNVCAQIAGTPGRVSSPPSYIYAVVKKNRRIGGFRGTHGPLRHLLTSAQASRLQTGRVSLHPSSCVYAVEKKTGRI